MATSCVSLGPNFPLFKIFTYLFLVVLSLHCCGKAFSSCSEWGLLSSCGVQVSHCYASLVVDGAQALGARASLAAAHWL